MTLGTKAVLATLAMLLVMGGIAAVAAHERAVGRQEQQAADNARIIATDKGQVAKADTVFVAKTDTLTRYIARTTTLHDTVLKHLTDTVLVKEYVATADSTIRACSDVVLSCDTVRARYRALVSADSVAALAPKPKAGLFAHFKKSVGVAAVYALDDHKLHAGPAISVGFTW